MESEATSLSTQKPSGPRRRPPLRSMTEKPSEFQLQHYPHSPKTGNETSHHYPQSEDCEISSDTDDRNSDEYYADDNDNSPEDLETLRQNRSLPNRLNTPISKCDFDGIKTPVKTSPYAKKSVELKSLKLQSKNHSVISKKLLWFIVGIIIAFISVSSVLLFNPQTVEEKPSTVSKYSEEKNKFKESIREIERTFPGQNRRKWKDIEAGIIDLINGTDKPCIIVLYSNKTNEVSCLAKMLGRASSKALHSKGSLELEANDMGDDFGLALDRWKNEINEKKAVVVNDVLEIDPRAIQALHSMCDRYNPLVKSVVYILTIITSGDIPRFEGPTKFIENQLTNRFINKVPEEKLQPLITRLTDGPLIAVEPEINFTACPV